jgi:hypothetical protein
MQIAIAIAVGFSLALSCTAAVLPDLKPRVAYPGEEISDDAWLNAPHVLVVMVKRADITSREVVVTPGGRLVMRLVEVEADVENELAGSLGAPVVRFYFFVNVPSEHGYTSPRFWLEQGKRYIVFLREESGVLRTMFDLQERSFRVYGGTHTNKELASLGTVGERIAVILLSPGAGYDPEAFAWGMATNVRKLRFVAPGAQVPLLLRGLATSPDRVVRESACIALSDEFRFTDPCLALLSQDPQTKSKAEVTRILAVQRKNLPALLERLRLSPLEASISGRTEHYAEELELFTADYYPEVRREACAALQRIFPARSLPVGCGEDPTPAGESQGERPSKSARQ